MFLLIDQSIFLNITNYYSYSTGGNTRKETINFFRFCIDKKDGTDINLV